MPRLGALGKGVPGVAGWQIWGLWVAMATMGKCQKTQVPRRSLSWWESKTRRKFQREKEIHWDKHCVCNISLVILTITLGNKLPFYMPIIQRVKLSFRDVTSETVFYPEEERQVLGAGISFPVISPLRGVWAGHTRRMPRYISLRQGSSSRRERFTGWVLK